MKSCRSTQQPEKAPGSISRNFDPRSKSTAVTGEYVLSRSREWTKQSFPTNSTEAAMQIDFSEEQRQNVPVSSGRNCDPHSKLIVLTDFAFRNDSFVKTVIEAGITIDFASKPISKTFSLEPIFSRPCRPESNIDLLDENDRYLIGLFDRDGEMISLKSIRSCQTIRAFA
jgi:hypothetical protein